MPDESKSKMWPLRIAGLVSIVLTLALLVGFFLFSWGGSGTGGGGGTAGAGADVQQIDIDALKYVGRAACAECHAEEVEQWHGSDHDRAIDPATEQWVLADFNDTTFTHFDVTSRFYKRDGRFYVYTDGPDGQMREFEIKYVFGYEPLQQYLIEFPDGRIQCLGVAWDTEKEEWFHLYPDEPIPHTDPLHWTKPLQNWNYMCAECHSTNLKKNFDLETNTYATTFSEIDVSCEACHGPGSAHVDWARENNLKGGDYTGDKEALQLSVIMKGKPNDVQIQVCAPCHSRRRVVAPGFRPGKPFEDHYRVELLNEPLYFPDGQILDEVYVYGSFLQSKMYHEDVRCTDCHDPHTTKLKFAGNALCTQCHTASEYDTFDHHFHEPNSKGASCVECHMRNRSYMVVDPRRDHSFQIPRPDLTVEIGVPNACNDCHLEEDGEGPQWAAEKVVEWYGPTRPVEHSFAKTFAAGREAERDVLQRLVQLAAERRFPALRRATALSLATRYQEPSAYQAMYQGLKDSSPRVRVEAITGLESLPPDDLFTHIAPLLEDPVRDVRQEAARVLCMVAPQRFEDRSKPYASAFWEALAEYREGQQELADQPGTHVNLAVMHERLGELALAEASYQTALRLQSDFVPALNNLAMLLAQQNRVSEAETYLRRAIAAEPEMGELAYSLGLLLAEQPGKLPEAVRYLQAAAKHSPDNPRVHYNLGLALQQLNQPNAALSALQQALSLQPNNGDFLNALVIFHAQRQQWRQALVYARRLEALYPDMPQLKQQVEMLEQRLRTEGR